jgi:6-pyruvoyltetrahydropterin/6-carboxytetrahydropterin synthase
VSTPELKFNCAHFIAFLGFRERLHGHNYTMSVRVSGEIGDDGYVIDFGYVIHVYSSTISLKSGMTEILRNAPVRFARV